MKLSIAVESTEPDTFAFIAAIGDVQTGWAICHDGMWYVEDMDHNRLAGPFLEQEAVIDAGERVLAPQAGASNPGW